MTTYMLMLLLMLSIGVRCDSGCEVVVFVTDSALAAFLQPELVIQSRYVILLSALVRKQLAANSQLKLAHAATAVHSSVIKLCR